MNKQANDMFLTGLKIIKENNDGKTICFIDRGTWGDPQIAIYGKLLNFWDVEELLLEGCVEHTDEDWICAAQDLYFGHVECGCSLDDFQYSDTLSVFSIINMN